MKFDANFWAAVAALGGVAAAVAAIVTATIAAKTLSAMRQDSLDRSRPVMIAELRPGVLTRNAELHITNQGLSVARNVEVTFAPPIAPHCPGKELSECEHIVHFIASGTQGQFLSSRQAPTSTTCIRMPRTTTSPFPTTSS